MFMVWMTYTILLLSCVYLFEEETTLFFVAKIINRKTNNFISIQRISFKISFYDVH